MSKKNDSVNIVTGADKFERFLQNYFKHIILLIGLVIVGVIATYIVIDVRNSSQAKKANYIGEAELTLNSPKAFTEFSLMASSYPFLSDYINLVTSLYYITTDNKTEALIFLPKVAGNYKEFSDAILVDLGTKVDMNKYLSKSSMPEVWYYKEILHSDKERQAVLMKEFEASYPDSKLLELLSNWGM